VRRAMVQGWGFASTKVQLVLGETGSSPRSDLSFWLKAHLRPSTIGDFRHSAETEHTSGRRLLFRSLPMPIG